MKPKQGEIYGSEHQYGVYARVDEVDEVRVLFSVWEVERPGWRGGARLPLEGFGTIYSDGPYPEDYVVKATAEAENLLDKSFIENEKYTVSLSSTHWQVLETTGVLAGWVEAREVGLTAEQCDKIAVATVAGIRQLIERWAWQERLQEQEGDENDRPGFGSAPSYRCYVERHEDCASDGPEKGCTCDCGHAKAEDVQSRVKEAVQKAREDGTYECTVTLLPGETNSFLPELTLAPDEPKMRITIQGQQDHGVNYWQGETDAADG